MENPEIAPLLNQIALVMIFSLPSVASGRQLPIWHKAFEQ